MECIFKLLGSLFIRKYAIKQVPTLSSKLFPIFAINDAVKMLLPELFKAKTITSDIVPVNPPYIKIPIGVPINGQVLTFSYTVYDRTYYQTVLLHVPIFCYHT